MQTPFDPTAYHDMVLPIKVFFRYGSDRTNLKNEEIDSKEESEQILHAEGYLFHKDIRRTLRVVITAGRSADIGSIYSSCSSML